MGFFDDGELWGGLEGDGEEADRVWVLNTASTAVFTAFLAADRVVEDPLDCGGESISGSINRPSLL